MRALHSQITQVILPTEHLRLTLRDHPAQRDTDDMYLTRLLPAHEIKKCDSILGHAARASEGIRVL